MPSTSKEKAYRKSAPRVYIRTFGCQMNERDSEIIYSMMLEIGYTQTSSYDGADLIIFNTCYVRKHAEDRVWGGLTQLGKAAAQDKGSHPKIFGLVGCMAKTYKDDIFKKLPHVDFICAPSDIYDIPGLVEQARAGKSHVASISKDKRPVKKEKDNFRENTMRSWVNISHGCDNFCSYCIVPFARGREISRPKQDIVDEIKRLVDKGTKEVTLLGQNVNSYQSSAGNGFVELLEDVNKIDGLKRIRFMTSHPKDASAALFKAIATLDKVCEHLHLPLQSGSDRILKSMNRGYTSSHYLKLIDKLRKLVPDCAITTDIIVGFPSETKEDFKCTRDIIKRIGFDSSFTFKYSPRPFTKASDMADDVSMDDKKMRNQVLLDLQDMTTKKKIKGLIGKQKESLGIAIAKRKPLVAKNTPGTYIKGRTREWLQVVYKGNSSLIGEVLNVKISGVEENTLIGDIV